MPEQTGNLFWGQGSRDYRLKVIEGHWPRDMEGSVYIVGPDKRRPGGHWFDGHGLVTKIGCRPLRSGEILVRAKRVNNRTNQLREKFPYLFVKRGPFELSPFGASNLANTALASMRGRLYVGYDGGHPVEIDRETLEYTGDLAPPNDWRPMLPGPYRLGARVSAHMAVEPNGSAMYFVNMAGTTRPGGTLPADLARWDGKRFKRWQLLGMHPYDTIHDVHVTENHVMFMDLPFPMPTHHLERHFPRRDTTRLWLVKKTELRDERETVRALEVEIPRPSAHFYVDYEERNGSICLFLQHVALIDPVSAIEKGDRSFRSGKEIPWKYWGMVTAGLPQISLGRYLIDANAGHVIDQTLIHNAERQWGLATIDTFGPWAAERCRKLYYASPGFDPDLLSLRWFKKNRANNAYAVPTAMLPRKAVPGALASFDLENMKLEQIYEFSGGAFPHPPTFVPRVSYDYGKPDDGYIIVIVHKERPKEIQVFDAARIADGPIARASMSSFNPSLLLHSHWMEF